MSPGDEDVAGLVERLIAEQALTGATLSRPRRSDPSRSSRVTVAPFGAADDRRYRFTAHHADRTTDETLAARWKEALGLRERVLKKLEEARAAKLVGKGTDAKVILPASEPALEGLDLAETLGVSQVARGGSEIVVAKADGTKCPRCWRWQTDVGSVSATPELCGRCARQL